MANTAQAAAVAGFFDIVGHIGTACRSVPLKWDEKVRGETVVTWIRQSRPNIEGRSRAFANKLVRYSTEERQHRNLKALS